MKMRDPRVLMERIVVDALVKQSGCSGFGDFLLRRMHGDSSEGQAAADAIDADEGVSEFHQASAEAGAAGGVLSE
jgi:hypothetical protein